MMSEIKIACTGAGLEDYRTLVDLQGNLKERTKEDIENVVRSILKHGWSFPFFIWKNGDAKYVFDGHGRIEALALMENTGYWLDKEGTLQKDGEPWTIPLLPSSYIFAETEQEAKIKLLKLNMRCGSLTEAGYALFTADMSNIDLDGVSIYFDVPQKITVDTSDYTNNLEAIDSYKEVNISIACPSCLEESTFTIKELLDSIGE
jgi:hypothetical protein